MTPHFANRTNVSGEAGIAGNNQDPVNWGPPRLTFPAASPALSDAQYARQRATRRTRWSARASGAAAVTASRSAATSAGSSSTCSRSRIRAARSASPARATGSDFADFLLGLPQTSAIAFGNADKYFAPALLRRVRQRRLARLARRSRSTSACAGSTSRRSPSAGRLVNLDVAPDFTAVSPVRRRSIRRARSPAGDYPDSLMRPDKRGIQPRLGIAWRPVAGSSLVVRAGYGIYRNTNVYQSIATLLAQQPPLSTTLSVADQRGPAADAGQRLRRRRPERALNTFAVDPDFRVGYAHNWQASVQRDLPASLDGDRRPTSGRSGSRLMQQFLPNTYPAGAANPCPDVSRRASSISRRTARRSRHAGQFQLRRRLRNGLTATVAVHARKAIDNAAAFGGASLSGAAIAQDWLDLDAERGPSNFDQRHQLTAQVAVHDRRRRHAAARCWTA